LKQVEPADEGKLASEKTITRGPSETERTSETGKSKTERTNETERLSVQARAKTWEQTHESEHASARICDVRMCEYASMRTCECVNMRMCEANKNEQPWKRMLLCYPVVLFLCVFPLCCYSIVLLFRCVIPRYFLSTIVDYMSVPLWGVVFTMFWCLIFSGINIRLTERSNQPGFVQLLFQMSPPRWAIEAFYINEMSFYADYLDISARLSYFQYSLDNYNIDIGAMFYIGLFWQGASLMLLKLVGRNRMK